MIRTIKAMGMALVAMFAMSALFAGAAQAEQGKFTWDSGTIRLTATQHGTGTEAHQTFATTAGSVTCNEVRGDAEVSGTSSLEVTATGITYNNSGSADTCAGPFGTTPKIEFNGCHYLFTAGTKLSASSITATVHIVCPNEKTIVINAPGCTISVPAQTPGGHIIFSTVTPPAPAKKHVTGVATVSEITYHHSGFLCGTGSAKNGTYNGGITIKGYSNVAHTTQTNVDVG